MKFTDLQQREWALHVNVAVLRRAKAVGIDLSMAVSQLRELLLDDVVTLDALWSIVAPNAKERGISLEAFEEGFDGKVERSFHEPENRSETSTQTYRGFPRCDTREPMPLAWGGNRVAIPSCRVHPAHSSILDARMNPLLPDDARWQAIRSRDRAADGSFVYAVRSTGIFCRPSCLSRPARRENVIIHETPEAALAGGFRACLRCHPDRAAGSPRLRPETPR